jgi:hypothetical protein
MKKIAKFFNRLINKFIEMSVQEANMRIAYMTMFWSM